MRSICGQVLFLRLLFLVFATFLAGCGGGNSTTSSPAAAAASVIGSTAVAAVANATPVGVAAVLGDRASLGQQIFTDRNLSEPRGTACVACHQTNLGFAGNNGSLIGVAVGSKPGSIGLRNAMTNAYSGFIPKFGFNTSAEETEAIGGHFWDGRSDTLSLQAVAPFLNPLEMNNPDRKSVVDKIAASTYAPLFKQEFGAAIFSDTDAAFTQIGLAIEAFERSTAMQSFSSKYDAMVRAQATFTPPEARGMALFMDAAKGNCAACHLMNPTSGKPEDSLFSEFTYYATGIPRNMAIPRNSDPSFYDLGLCGPERTAPTLPANAIAGVTIENFCGKFRMPTLRNVAERPAFMHNGFFKDLRDVVRFYSNRKITSTSNDLPAKYQANIEKVKAPFNRAATDGPALTEAEVNDIVAFLRTLSDGYRAP
jgi:cytochrome c peroxidase